MFEELKRCPFCGAEAELVRNSGGSYFARCTDRQCAARTRLYHENESGARLAWNRRAERTCRDLTPTRREFTCSACGCEAEVYIHSEETGAYCPNCGARVIGEETGDAD